MHMIFMVLSNRDNFKVVFDQTNTNMTVFHLLEHACIGLMKHSFTIKGQEGNQLPHHFVYNRMLWSKFSLSLSLSLCVCVCVCVNLRG